VLTGLLLIVGDTLNPTTFLDFIQAGGIVGILLLILVGGFRRWWVFGWYYNELMERHTNMRQERDAWKELALRSTNLAESLQEIGRLKGMP